MRDQSNIWPSLLASIVIATLFFSGRKLGGLTRFYAAVVRALCVLLDFVITVQRGCFFRLYRGVADQSG